MPQCKSLAKYDRLETVQLLVEQLTTISELALPETDQEKRTDDMHVIWCIRALRYLTSLDFRAKTAHKFGKDDEEQYRDQFLHKKDDKEATFFGVWMSREYTFVAPVDAQRKIIKKWKKWLKNEATRFNFPPPDDDWDKWYF